MCADVFCTNGTNHIHRFHWPIVSKKPLINIDFHFSGALRKFPNSKTFRNCKDKLLGSLYKTGIFRSAVWSQCYNEYIPLNILIGVYSHPPTLTGDEIYAAYLRLSENFLKCQNFVSLRERL